MNHFEALEAIKDSTYASADFYRMQYSDTIALVLMDKPPVILMDVQNHGSANAKLAFDVAEAKGYIELKEGENGFRYYDVVETPDSAGAPYQYRSHIAMQIAYPKLYWDYFQGEHVWTYFHEKMDKLIRLCFEVMNDPRVKSDYFGEHVVTEDEPRKRGRPKAAPVKKVASGHSNWVKACQEYKAHLTELWNEYLESCKRRQDELQMINDDIAALKARHANELSVLMGQLADRNAELKKECDNVYQRHQSTKAQGKPNREDYT